MCIKSCRYIHYRSSTIPKRATIRKILPYTEHIIKRIVGFNQCMPTPTTETSIVLNAHRVHPGILASIFFFIKGIEIKKAKRNARKKKKKIKTIQQCWVEFTLTEYPGRADLPSPHYSPAGQSAREMDLGVGH